MCNGVFLSVTEVSAQTGHDIKINALSMWCMHSLTSKLLAGGLTAVLKHAVNNFRGAIIQGIQ